MSAPNVIRLAGAVLGTGLAVALLLISRPGAASAPLPASLRIEASPVGELEVAPSPPRAVLAAPALRPGGPEAGGDLVVRNQTGKGLDIALRAEVDSTLLDSLLRVSAQIGGRTVASGTLEDLVLHPIRLSLASGQRTRLHLAAWLPASVRSGYEGARAEVLLAPSLDGPKAEE